MRYKVVATLSSGTRVEVETPLRERGEDWFRTLGRMALAGPKAISLTQESDSDKDVILAIGGT